MKTVIPKRRVLVKTMIYHSVKDFFYSLFRPPSSAIDGTDPPTVNSEPAAATSNRPAIGYRVGGGGLGKMKTVIPKRRVLAKTMIYHSVKDFFYSLFRPPSSAVDGTDPPTVNSEPAAATSNRPAIGYRVGGGGLGKMKTVIPKRRVLVKTMIYHSVKDFFYSLFRPPSSAVAVAPQPPPLPTPISNNIHGCF